LTVTSSIILVIASISLYSSLQFKSSEKQEKIYLQEIAKLEHEREVEYSTNQVLQENIIDLNAQVDSIQKEKGILSDQYILANTKIKNQQRIIEGLQQSIKDVEESFFPLQKIIADTTKGNIIPEQFALHQNYPNPFNPTTQIQFNLPKPSRVEVTIFNILGQHVRVLVDKQYESGLHTLVWDGRDNSGDSVSPGVYILRFASEDLVKTRKLLYLP